MTWARPHKFLEWHASYGFPTYAAFEQALHAAVTAGRLAVMYRGRIMPEWAREELLPPGKSFDHRTAYGLPPNICLDADEVQQLFLGNRHVQ
jgi:hypothetical protein